MKKPTKKIVKTVTRNASARAAAESVFAVRSAEVDGRGRADIAKDLALFLKNGGDLSEALRNAKAAGLSHFAEDITETMRVVEHNLKLQLERGLIAIEDVVSETRLVKGAITLAKEAKHHTLAARLERQKAGGPAAFRPVLHLKAASLTATERAKRTEAVRKAA